MYLKVEAEVIKLQESRRGSASKSEAQDMAISILRLRLGSNCLSYFLLLPSLLFSDKFSCFECQFICELKS